MDDQNIIGKEFGSLTVERFNVSTGKFECRCKCGRPHAAMRHSLVTFKVDRCAECKTEQRYLNSLATDPKYLRDLTPDQAAKVLSAYAQHLRACARNDVPAVAFAIFVGEMKQDPGAFDPVEVESWEETLAAVTQQRYRQYEPPKDLITRIHV
jgi:hypothetical protein